MAHDSALRYRLQRIILGWDFLLAFLITIVVGLLLICGRDVPLHVANQIFSMSIGLHSILFSVFFAVLAILITSSDDTFARFLEEDHSYTEILWSYKVTLLILFLALLLSLGLFILSLPYESSVPLEPMNPYPTGALILFCFISAYALMATMNSCLEAIRYARYRVRFISLSCSLVDSDSQ